MPNQKLTNAEKNIIFKKGTEPPFSGRYNDFFETGTYLCRRCQIPLYKSASKFKSHCGWPSFDEAIGGRIKQVPDADGQRTEIQCFTCSAHLGHVFSGEKFTEKNKRYCVNSLALEFVPAAVMPEFETAVFGGGCFWCTEAVYKRFKGIFSVLPGYSGGRIINPTYAEVSRGDTGHAEVIKIEFNPGLIDYKTLLEIFFETHNPTTLNRQGNDIGRQYRSVIFYTDDGQKNLANNYIARLKAEKKFTTPIVTETKPLVHFYPAEDYHRDYFKNHQEQTYCQLIISPKIKKIEQLYSRLIKF